MASSFKFVLGWAVVFLFRLISFRPPNFEPMLATLMPFSKRYGLLGSFSFSFFGIVLYDAVTSGWGAWTWITAFAYGALGIAAHLFFKHREATVRNFLGFGIAGTVLYDAITGLTIGPIVHHQPFMLALTGQIPFTLMHLMGTAVFAVTLSPALYRWVIRDEAFAILSPWTRKTSGATH